MDDDGSPPVVVDLFWKHAQTGEEISVEVSSLPGETFCSNTFPGHVLWQLPQPKIMVQAKVIIVIIDKNFIFWPDEHELIHIDL